MAGSKGALSVVNTGNPEDLVDNKDYEEAAKKASALFDALTPENQITRTLDDITNEPPAAQQDLGKVNDPPKFIPGPSGPNPN